jgi:hypothetical protein
VDVDWATEAADIGSAVHQLLAARIGGFEWDVDAVALEWNCDPDELSRLFGWSWRAWLSVAKHFPEPRQIERELTMATPGPVMLSGHVDLLCALGSEIRLLDWKTGRVDADHRQQIMGYCWLALQNYPDSESAYAMVLRVRDQSLDAHRYSRAELDRWYANLCRKMDTPHRFRPGRHCVGCPRGASCPAKTALISQAAQGLSGFSHDFLTQLPPPGPARGQVLAELLDRVKLIERVCEQAREMVRADVARQGGSMVSEDGRELRLVSSDRTRILYEEAWPLLARMLPTEIWNQVVEIKKGEVEKAVRQAAPYRQGGKAVAALLAELERLGAVTKTAVSRLEVRRSQAQIESEKPVCVSEASSAE